MTWSGWRPASGPAVVWFGEPLDDDDAGAALAACACDLFLTVGTSPAVYPAAGLTHEARRRGACTVEVNAEATAASAFVDLAIRAAAERILPALDARVAPERDTGGQGRGLPRSRFQIS